MAEAAAAKGSEGQAGDAQKAATPAAAVGTKIMNPMAFGDDFEDGAEEEEEQQQEEATGDDLVNELALGAGDRSREQALIAARADGADAALEPEPEALALE